MQHMQVLTEGGAGRLVEVDELDVDQRARQLLEAAVDGGFALARGLDLTRESFVALVKAAGSTAEHRFGTGSSELLELVADPDPDKIVTGRAELPMHTDGAIVGTHPSFIILYCKATQQQPGMGETVICQQQSLLDALPEHLRRLFNGKWEYLTFDASHFPSVAGRWVATSAMVPGRDGQAVCNIAMPFESTTRNPGWRVRLEWLDNETSQGLLDELATAITTASGYYAHRWAAGDLLVIDNDRVLHGRTRISPGTRHLYRAQLQ
jgi:alpha-ketoglutarate-dependent taurine dioxygenase